MRVLAFGAHPDDIEIGAGGTLARHAAQGDEVLMVVASIPSDHDRRVQEAKNAAKILGANIQIVDFQRDEMLFNRGAVKQFDQIIADFGPDVVYSHWNHDSHQDHISVSYVTIAAGRKVQFSLYMYEPPLPSAVVPYNFHPQSFSDISDFLAVKRASLEAHASQVIAYGDRWIDVLEARASHRGFQIGVMHAEVFEVVKQIDSLFNRQAQLE